MICFANINYILIVISTFYTFSVPPLSHSIPLHQNIAKALLISVEMCKTSVRIHTLNPRNVDESKIEILSVKLSNGDLWDKIDAAKEIRKVVRASEKARSAFAVSSIVDPLISMLSMIDWRAKESALLALLNLAVRNERNKEIIVNSGIIPYLIVYLKSSNNNLQDLATASILTLSTAASNRPIITASGAIPLLVKTLVSGSIQGKVDAVTTLHNLSNSEYAHQFTISVTATSPLINLLKDSRKHSKFAEKTSFLLQFISHSTEGLTSISEAENSILTLVETVEEGSELSTEYAVDILHALCVNCRERNRELILKEGPIPGLLLLTVEGSDNAQGKAQKLLELLRDDGSRMKRVGSAIVYSVGGKADVSRKAEKAAKKVLRSMVRNSMELNLRRIQNRAVLGPSN